MKILQYIFKSISLFALTIFFSNTYAASIDHFSVTMSPEKAKVGESIDITIKAVDINNNLITDYKGTILVFSESDPEADFPNALKENSYTFVASDEGEIKFENAVKFQTIGTQDIHVYELEDDTVVGLAEVEITGDDIVPNINIEILSPENGITIGETETVVSGLTNKNYGVIIKINNKREIQTTSNGEGIFEEKITGLKNGNNTLSAQIINSDGDIIGTSGDTILRVESSKPRIRDISISPEGDLTPRQQISIEMISSTGLSEVNIVIDDVIVKLKEEGNGIYKGTTNAPKKIGNYSIDTILRDEIGNETKELGVETITVIAGEEITTVPPTIEPINESSPQIIPESTPVVEQSCTKETKVSGLKLTKLKTKSILNWNIIKDTSKYNVYKKLENGELELVQTVTDPIFSIDIVGDELTYDYFAIKPICNGDDDTEFEGSLSDATKIQTGPELIILGLLSILFTGLLVFYRKRA